MEWHKFDHGVFLVVLQAIVYNPDTGMILIGKRENDPNMPELSWTFIGGRSHYDELDDSVRRIVKEKSGIDVEVKDVVFSKTYPENRKIMSIYFMTTYDKGLPKSEHFAEFKWVRPTDVKRYFTTSLHPKVYEFLVKLEKKGIDVSD